MVQFILRLSSKLFNWVGANKHFLTKYLIVGLSGLAINFFLLYFFTDILGLWYLFSFVVAWFLTITFNFLLNKSWTFGANKKESGFRQYFQTLGIYIFTFILSVFTMYILTSVFGIWYIVSSLLINIAYPAINFLFFRYWVFGKKSQTPN